MKTFILIIFCFTFLIIPSVYSQKGRPGPKIVDIDGNSYKTVYIGKQHWMAENLKVSKYNDGTPIPNFYSVEWYKALEHEEVPLNDGTGHYTVKTIDKNIGAWCFYDNNASNNAKFGKLYNWYVVGLTKNENKNVCPVGWHVPTSSEWRILAKLITGPKYEPGYNSTYTRKMQEVGSWELSKYDKQLTNESLFSARPGGYRSENEFIIDFSWIGLRGFWWSSSMHEEIGSTVYFTLDKNSLNLYIGSKGDGRSVRCLKD